MGNLLTRFHTWFSTADQDESWQEPVTFTHLAFRRACHPEYQCPDLEANGGGGEEDIEDLQQPRR